MIIEMDNGGGGGGWRCAPCYNSHTHAHKKRGKIWKFPLDWDVLPRHPLTEEGRIFIGS